MPLRILLADSSRRVVAAVGRDLEERGLEVDAVAPAAAAARAASGSYGAALVRGTGAAAEVVAALRAADPLLPVVVLFLDRKEADAAGPLEADGVLVGPLTASAVGTVCAFAGKLRDAGARAAELEARLAAARHGRDLDFLKKLLLVEVKRSRRHGHPLSLALVSIDGWSERAARLGGRARAALLAEVLGVVSGGLREIDLAVPLSDERIAVTMPHTGADGALRVARRIAARIREHAFAGGLTASVGVASHAGDGTLSFGGLVRRAGEALARARAGRGPRRGGRAAQATGADLARVARGAPRSLAAVHPACAATRPLRPRAGLARATPGAISRVPVGIGVQDSWGAAFGWPQMERNT